MNKREKVWIVSVSGLLLLIGVVLWLVISTPTGTIVIEVTSNGGGRFEGTAEVDGVQRALSGSAPATISLDGYTILYSIAPDPGAGEVTVNVGVGGGASDRVSSGNPPFGIRGWAQFRRFAPLHWIESFDQKEPGQWINPPPRVAKGS